MVFLGETDPEHPRRIPIKQVDSGDRSSIFLLENDTLWYAGDDMFCDACSGYDVVLA